MLQTWTIEPPHLYCCKNQDRYILKNIWIWNHQTWVIRYKTALKSTLSLNPVIVVTFFFCLRFWTLICTKPSAPTAVSSFSNEKISTKIQKNRSFHKTISLTHKKKHTFLGHLLYFYYVKNYPLLLFNNLFQKKKKNTKKQKTKNTIT